MIFNTINSTIEKTNYTIKIANIDAATYHWGSEKTIQNSLAEVEYLLYEPETLNDKLIDWALSLAHANTRIRAISFFRVKSENRLIILARTDVARLHEPEILSREMSIRLHKHNFSLSVIELLEEEEKNATDAEYPSNWVRDKELQSKYDKMVAFLFA